MQISPGLQRQRASSQKDVRLWLTVTLLAGMTVLFIVLRAPAGLALQATGPSLRAVGVSGTLFYGALEGASFQVGPKWLSVERVEWTWLPQRLLRAQLCGRIAARNERPESSQLDVSGVMCLQPDGTFAIEEVRFHLDAEVLLASATEQLEGSVSGNIGYARFASEQVLELAGSGIWSNAQIVGTSDYRGFERVPLGTVNFLLENNENHTAGIRMHNSAGAVNFSLEASYGLDGKFSAAATLVPAENAAAALLDWIALIAERIDSHTYKLAWSNTESPLVLQ